MSGDGRYESFKIEDVMRVVGVNVRAKRGSEIFFDCPACGTKKPYKCSANVEKNVWSCFKCGAKGGALNLYMQGDPTASGDPKEAARELHRLIENGEFRQPAAGDNRPFPEETYTEAKRADAGTVDRTYRVMLAFSGLSKGHKRDLLNRFLTEKEIADGLFATMPDDRVRICENLLHAGCTLEGVPGFFKNRDGRWELSGRPGYCCPSFDDKGRITGIQIRGDNPRGCKYVWLSTRGREKGTPSGSPATFLGRADAETVIITEGILKAYASYCFLGKPDDTAVIGIAGAGNPKGVADLLRRHSHRKALCCLDMDRRMAVENDRDRAKREMLGQAERKLKECVLAAGVQYRNALWDTDGKGGWNGEYKGLDDWLARRRAEE